MEPKRAQMLADYIPHIEFGGKSWVQQEGWNLLQPGEAEYWNTFRVEFVQPIERQRGHAFLGVGIGSMMLGSFTRGVTDHGYKRFDRGCLSITDRAIYFKGGRHVFKIDFSLITGVVGEFGQPKIYDEQGIRMYGGTLHSVGIHTNAGEFLFTADDIEWTKRLILALVKRRRSGPRSVEELKPGTQELADYINMRARSK